MKKTITDSTIDADVLTYTVGEDPVLAAKLCVPMIKGVQSYDVAATVKHFCLNNQEWNRNHVDTHVDARTFNEIYLPAFKAAVQEGEVLCVMTSYNKVDGLWASENKYNQRGILRDRWGFKGLIETDWGGQHSCDFAINNGGGIEMHWGQGIKYLYNPKEGKFPLAEAVRAGKVPEANVDEAALHTENAAITAASDSLGSVSLTGYEIVKLVKASRACSEMALSAFESYIVEVIAEAVARRIEKYIFTGTGTNQPGGVKTAGKGASGAYTDGTDQITVGKTASLTEENVIALYGLLGDGYERNAVWCMNKATFFSDFFPLMNKSKNNVIEFANGKYYIMGAEVYFTGSLAAHEAYLGDFSYIIGNYSQDITVVRSEHSGLATNSIDYLGACVFDSKPVAGFGAFVHLAKAAA